MLWYIENVNTCSGKNSETITSWHNRISLFAEEEQRVSTSFLILNHNLLDVCFTPAWPLCVPSFAILSPPASLLLSAFSLVSRTSSLFKVQATKASCLNPEAVIDRLTKREGGIGRASRWRESEPRAGGEDSPGACLNRRLYFCPSRCVINWRHTGRGMRWQMVSAGVKGEVQSREVAADRDRISCSLSAHDHVWLFIV